MLKLFRYLKNYKLQSIIGPLFKLVEACFELAVPLVMAKIIDVGIVSRDERYIIQMGGVLILLGILGLACALTAQFFAAKASVGLGTEMRNDLYRHINTFSHSEIDKIGASTLVTRMTVDTNLVQMGINMLLRLFLRSPFIAIGAIIMAFTISVRLTLVFLIAAPLLAIVIYFIVNKTIPMFKRIQRGLDKTTLMVDENLSGARVIRAFSRQKSEMKAFSDNSDELNRLQIAAGRISALLNPCTYVLIYLAIIAIVWYGGVEVNIGKLTQGQLIALISYMNQILLALIAVAVLVTSITKAHASSLRINEIFDLQATFDEGTASEETNLKTSPVVEFSNVNFAYGENLLPVLHDITFTAQRGETIGVIGGTGCGKSTLVNLIPRFYQCQSGSVKVNSKDVSDYTFDNLRGRIGIVPQRAVLFKGTVRENMKWRNDIASDEEICNALEIAQALDFVMENPNGLDSKIMQGGQNLSGGQRQRLTIARALVGNPEILILDDSSSALDMATDARLRKAISEKTCGITVFIVSQRISSIRHADRILVLDDGVIVGQGTHSQLLEGCTVYKEICLSQLSAEEVAENA